MARPVRSLLSLPLYTALPTGMTASDDGTTIRYLADATKGIEWWLAYRHFQPDRVTVNPSAYKWEYIGGPELNERGTFVGYGGGDFSTGSNSYIDVPGMSGITLPLAGDWTVDYGFTELRSDTTGQGRWWGVVLNSGLPPIEHFYQANVVNDYGRGSRYVRDWTIAAAGSVLRLQVKTSGIGVTVFNGGYLRVRPVRVG
jgi:hypothetical protein